MAYVKYGWAANQIADEDMASLYHLKKATKKHITTMVGEAVKLYLSHQNKTEDVSKTEFYKGILQHSERSNLYV